MINNIVLLIVGLVVAALLMGTIFISGVGSLANATKGTACVNCQATTKTMLQNTEIFLVFAVFLAIIGAGVGAFVVHKRGSN